MMIIVIIIIITITKIIMKIIIIIIIVIIVWDFVFISRLSPVRVAGLRPLAKDYEH